MSRRNRYTLYSNVACMGKERGAAAAATQHKYVYFDVAGVDLLRGGSDHIQ